MSKHLKFDDGVSVDVEMNNMTKTMIMAAAPEVIFGRADKRNKSHLLETVTYLPRDVQDRIRALAHLNRGTVTMDVTEHNQLLSADREEMDVDEDEGEEVGDFMKTASQTTVHQCISNFIDATGDAAVVQHVCMVCARELWAYEVDKWLVRDIGNKGLLAPKEPHPAHMLTSGMLLEREVMEGNGDEIQGDVCHDCLRSMNSRKTPPLALANGMWVGPIPRELAILTLPERILVGRYFPAAFIVKLYPKQKGAKHWPTSGLNSAVHGNVSTYKLNTDDIVDMIDADVMPPPASILASTIGVSIVGPKNIPERTMPGFLRVRRERIRAALVWLKGHNPLYARIVISQHNLDGLPFDGVPHEILDALRYSDNMEMLEKERAGYVVDDDDIETEKVEVMAGGVRPVEDNGWEDEDGIGPNADPEVVPLQSLGVVDVGASDVAERDVFAHALANVSQTEMKTAYAVKRGSQFVNEYPRTNVDGRRTDGGPDDPNHLMGAFPVLYPYAKGGLEVDRIIQVPYSDHARWSLQYWDKRFRKDLHFVFQVFGVLQKRQVCNSAGLQIKRKDFLRNEQAIKSLKPADLVQAASEESRRLPFSNPAVQSLRKHITSVRAKVMGTDESRVGIRSKIWSLTAQLGPPSLWITINPSDTADPIAQVLAGVDIDLDKFDKTLGPDAATRAATVAADPYAAAKFFHFIVDTVIRELFGIKAHTKSRHMEKKRGIFGNMAGYIGTVEAQGRGTLHFHVVCWLKDAPTSAHMKDLLRGEKFRQRIVEFIKVNIRSDIAGVGVNKLRAMERQNAVSYSRPEDPRVGDYAVKSQKAEESLARAVQVHSCTTAACLQLVKGRLKCKRNAPFDLSERDWIDEDGSWGSRRVYGYLNAWMPAILQTVRANQDIKLITNGEDTKNVSWYITNYVAKKQRGSSNSSALLARRIVFHNTQEKYNADIAKRNKRLLQRCANTLTREQEFSAPEAISYVMGWMDRKISHHFVTMFTGELFTAIKNAYPRLRYKKHERCKKSTDDVAMGEAVDEERNVSGLESLPRSESLNREPIDDEEPVMITVVDGQLQACSQLKEYAERGSLLSDYCLLDFIRDTYDGTKLSTKRTKEGTGSSRASIRSDYRSDDGRASKCWVLRRQGHQTMVEFVGSWFPRSDNVESWSMYCTTMLVLLVPWQHLASIHGSSSSIEDEFISFEARATVDQLKFIHNIQYFHESSDSAQRKRAEDNKSDHHRLINVEDIIDERSEDEEMKVDIEVPQVTEEQIEEAICGRFCATDQLFATTAMAIAEDVGIFMCEEVNSLTNAIHSKFGRYATTDDVQQFREWEDNVNAIGHHDTQESLPDTSADIDPCRLTAAMDIDPEVAVNHINYIDDLPHLKALNVEQHMAHDIIINHLDAYLDDRNPRQILMMVIGQGGTGKSTLLNAITTSFIHRDVPHLLAKTAMSGVAASLIGGSTLHLWAGLPVQRLPQGDEWMAKSRKDIRMRREKNVGVPIWLAIDEMGMLTKDLTTYLSQVAGAVRTGDGHADSTIAFGALNILLIGDFHQFPPVGHNNASLYSSQNPRISCTIGENLFNQFDTVIELTEQRRITDPVWRDILHNARTGDCNAENLAEIRKLVLTNPACDIPNFMVTPWNDAVLVTPRNCVRVMWNEAKLKEHCARTGQVRYVIDAEDTAGRDRRPLSAKERLHVAKLDIDATQKIENRITVAIGMKAMVTKNIATDLGLANGSRGTIVDIVLDGRETTGPKDIIDGAVHLEFPPAMILFEPSGGPEFETFPGLKPGQVPIFPTEVKFNIGDKKNRTIIARRQITLTPAYAFTDHKGQGQMLGNVVVDISKLKTFPVNQFAAYVALSRSRGRDSIRLLRDFDDRLFTVHPSEDLKEEDERLQVLVKQTKENWNMGLYHLY